MKACNTTQRWSWINSLGTNSKLLPNFYWAKEAETLIPQSDAKQGEQQQQLSLCLFAFGQQMCNSKQEN